MALVALAWGGLNLARAQVTPIPTWTQQSPATSPPARDSASMAYDAATGQVVLFGGEASSALLNDTWTWNGTIWTQQSPANSPAAREEASMAYDAATGQVVLFGGLDPNSVNCLNDTWTWDGTNWTQQNPATSPPGRFKRGWYVLSTPIVTADWTAERDKRWTVPFGGGTGKIFKVGR